MKTTSKKRTIYTCFLGIILLSAALTLLTYYYFFKCNVSDEQALKIADNFCSSFDIKINDGGFSVLNSNPTKACLKTKSVFFGPAKTFMRGISVDIDCRSGDIYSYRNSGIIQDFIDKYGGRIKPGNMEKEYVNWPPAMSEIQAKSIIDSLAVKLKIPADMVFNGLTKEGEGKNHSKDGYWVASWVRERMGYRYENDRALIEIMGATGHFVSYRKDYFGTPCSTDVLISKEKAIELGQARLIRLIGNETWTKAKDRYKTTAQLLIIQPSVIVGYTVPFWASKKSRLAWVIKFEITDTAGWEELGAPTTFVDIRIDAGTGKYLGGWHSKS